MFGGGGVGRLDEGGGDGDVQRLERMTMLVVCLSCRTCSLPEQSSEVRSESRSERFKLPNQLSL